MQLGTTHFPRFGLCLLVSVLRYTKVANELLDTLFLSPKSLLGRLHGLLYNIM